MKRLLMIAVVSGLVATTVSAQQAVTDRVGNQTYSSPGSGGNWIYGFNDRMPGWLSWFGDLFNAVGRMFDGNYSTTSSSAPVAPVRYR